MEILEVLRQAKSLFTVCSTSCAVRIVFVGAAFEISGYWYLGSNIVEVIRALYIVSSRHNPNYRTSS